jgi:hypothetical protein
MKNKILNIVILIIGAIAVLYPYIVWFNKPTITTMEIFVMYWWMYMIGVIFLLWHVKRVLKNE